MVIKKWVELLLSRRDDEVFILNGYAGTGKTTVLSALVATLKELGLRFRQMAPTGRAAKVMSRLTGLPAYTIPSTGRKAMPRPTVSNWVRACIPAQSLSWTRPR